MPEGVWLPYVTAFLFILNTFIPRDFRPDFDRWFGTLFSFVSPFIYYTIPEYDGHINNELFSSVQVYLSDLAATRASDLNISTAKNASSLTFALSASSHAIPDSTFRLPASRSGAFEAVKVHIKNYLQVDEHPAFKDIRRAIEDEKGQITPAEVSEVLTKEKRNVEEALRRLVEEIVKSKEKREAERKQKQKEEEEKAKEKEEEEEEKAKEKENNEKEEGKNKRSSCDCCGCCCCRNSSGDGGRSLTEGLQTTAVIP